MIDPAGIISGVPSPISENVNGPPKSSPPFASHPLAFSLITSTLFERLTQPVIAVASNPTSAPSIGPS